MQELGREDLMEEPESSELESVVSELESIVGFRFEERWRVHGVFYYHAATHEYFRDQMMAIGKQTLRFEHELCWRLQPPTQSSK